MILGALDFGFFHKFDGVESLRVAIVDLSSVNSSVSGHHGPLGFRFHLVDLLLNRFWWNNHRLGFFYLHNGRFNDRFSDISKVFLINILNIRIIKNLTNLLITFFDLSTLWMSIGPKLDGTVPHMTCGSLFYRQRIAIFVGEDHLLSWASNRIIIIVLISEMIFIEGSSLWRMLGTYKSC